MVSLVLLHLTFVTSVLSQFSRADESDGFYNPPPHEYPNHSSNPVWVIGERQVIRWSTSFPEYSMVLMQQSRNGSVDEDGPSVFETTKATVTQFDWLVQNFQFDLAVSNIFYFMIAGDSSGFSSFPFNMTSAPLSTTSSTSTTFSTPTSTLGYTSTLPTLPSSPTPSDTSSSGLSKTSLVGIGIGVAIAIVLAIVSAFIIYSRKKEKAGPEHQPLQQNPIPEPTVLLLPLKPVEMEHVDRGPGPPPVELA
ncbi:uncharacterized protein BP5553_00912 [Venustampulla echinocandica]|uniref:Mid2 domain-containing protein n=1 Tax=Venustampulla echinocandica TaxID=2656787 RepID=A0A370TZH1_9HELO|nr:uncharacterized protein BP5553_00912 [Venustampulla echinocandica]RDL40933.1 hypothetical protein BP5553_00912 [Venustampulla echinocandica]